MRAGLDPFSFLVLSMAGWLNQKQEQVTQSVLSTVDRSGCLMYKYRRAAPPFHPNNDVSQTVKS
jgi:hypothetical protein